MYRLSPVKCNGRYYEVNHLFSQEEIEALIKMPKKGLKISFEQAYELRWMEGSYLNRLFTYKVMNMSIYEYCISRNYYIEFKDDELQWVAA